MRIPARSNGPWPVGLAVLLLAAGCLAPRSPGAEGGLGEVGRMMGEAGAEPVTGTVDEGRTAGLEPTDPDPESIGAALASDEPEEEPELEESPYIRFGERIIVRDVEGTTFVTKPYNLPTGRPQKIVQLMGALEPFAFPPRQRPVPQDGTPLPPLDPSILEYQILSGFDDEFYTIFPTFDSAPKASTIVPLSDVLVVTAVPDLLEEFEDFLDLFAGGGVPQIELEAKIIEILETDTTDIGFSVQNFVFGDANFVKSLVNTLPNFADSTEAVLTLGTVQDGVAFDAILEAIKSWQNVTIESRPRTVVRAGGVARMETAVEIPFLQFKTLDASGVFTTVTEYKRVGTQLWISPRMVGSNTLALDVHLEGSQRIGSTVIVSGGTSASQSIDVPTVAYRTAKTVVHLKPGQTLVIGGLTQEREQEIVNKVPILGDIPILGFFFRSTFTTKERQHVLFAISPRIIQRSDFDSDL
jgi:type II secretory pathway component GspD/PulD (secretin)